ncbi:LppU/SCO3897 family protein [Nocardioides daeguensis]|uniref:LppU/SCO3897 family protein n=1 Tax=Nocardioides daeguensis TaxID=908359 RepID=UPI001C440332|nr:hypothetical protein [Nocardioides daeguensis]MBV6727248.1 hypothetical protein [Nocardioides daeguensis]MCR1771262.1 hypothetical protein [Nocardioides daeguensis]
MGQEKVEEAKAPKVGECVNLTGSSMNADHDEIDCGDAEATFKIVSDKGNCDDAEQNYTISLGTTDSGNVADLCLALNAAKGDCFDLGSMSTAATKVACAGAGAGSSVVKVVLVGKAGDECANGAQPLENKQRKTLLCLGRAA